MTANEIRDETMTMDFNDPRAVADALQHVAEKLGELEHAVETMSEWKADRPYKREGAFGRDAFDTPERGL